MKTTALQRAEMRRLAKDGRFRFVPLSTELLDLLDDLDAAERVVQAADEFRSAIMSYAPISRFFSTDILKKEHELLTALNAAYDAGKGGR